VESSSECHDGPTEVFDTSFKLWSAAQGAKRGGASKDFFGFNSSKFSVMGAPWGMEPNKSYRVVNRAGPVDTGLKNVGTWPNLVIETGWWRRMGDMHDAAQNWFRLTPNVMVSSLCNEILSLIYLAPFCRRCWRSYSLPREVTARQQWWLLTTSDL
jgi:hypothetical protein